MPVNVEPRKVQEQELPFNNSLAWCLEGGETPTAATAVVLVSNQVQQVGAGKQSREHPREKHLRGESQHT